jgi:hypothetical protein
MSLAPQPAELSAPRDPAAYRPGRAAWLWPAVGFGLSGLVLGVFLALFVSGLNKAPAPDTPPPAPPAAEPLETAAPPPVAPAPTAVGAVSGDLEGRIAALEQDRRRTAQAAAAALSAAALIEASQGSAPFAEELAALSAAAPDTPELRGLRGLAEAGAPSRAALAGSFPEAAARAAAAAHDPGDSAAWGERIGHVLSRVISIRRVGEVSGAGRTATGRRRGCRGPAHPGPVAGPGARGPVRLAGAG